MRGHGYLLSPEARQDLLDLWEYIAQDSIDAADRIRDALFAAMDRLAEMPYMGHLREDLSDEPIRFWRVHSYLILYRAEKSPMEVIRIVSGYRDIRSLIP